MQLKASARLPSQRNKVLQESQLLSNKENTEEGKAFKTDRASISPVKPTSHEQINPQGTFTKKKDSEVSFKKRDYEQ
jgi:hypothetical protein